MSQQFRREYCHVQPLVSYNGNRISQRKKKKKKFNSKTLPPMFAIITLMLSCG